MSYKNTINQNNDLNNTKQTNPAESSKTEKEENLYLYYSNLGRKIMQKHKTQLDGIDSGNKHFSKESTLKSSKVLQGVYSDRIKGDTFRFAKTKSFVDLKRAGRQIIEKDRPVKQENTAELMMKQFNEILKSEKDERKNHRSSMGTLPSAKNVFSSTSSHAEFKHYPIRRLDQNQIMFNEIFVKPKVDQLKVLAHQREQEMKRFRLPNIKNNQEPQIDENDFLDFNPSSDELERDVDNNEDDFKKLLKERQDQLREANKDEKSLDISSLLERRKFIKNTDNLFADDEDMFKKINKTDIEELNETELREFNEKVQEGAAAQYEFQNYLINSTRDNIEEEENDVVRIIMNKFNSKARTKKVGTFFTQQIQVQPPEGLINIIGAEGSWAPSIPVSGANKSLNKSKFKDKSMNDVSLQDIKMRAKAGVQAGDVKKEAHMAFCLGSLNEERNINKAIRYYKRFFFCARILEDPVGAALALNRLGVAYHKIKDYEKSLLFHTKHREYTDKENLFAAYYNLGISQRLLKMYDDSVKSFSKALEWASLHQELDSECFCNGQLGITELIRNNKETSSKHFISCLTIAKMLKNTRLQLDCLLCLGYLTYSKQEYEESKTYFMKAHKAAKSLKEPEIAEQCL